MFHMHIACWVILYRHVGILHGTHLCVVLAQSHNVHVANTIFLWSHTAATIFFAACFRAATIQGWRLFLWQAHRHQEQLDEECTSDAVMLLDAFNSPHSSLLSSKIRPTCVHVYIYCSYYSRVAFISLRVPVVLLLFEGGNYSRYVTCTCCACIMII